MLKQLLQLLLETFLKSKKSWVGNQAMPSSSPITYSNVKREEWVYLTAPHDGYFYVMARQTTGVDLLAEDLSILSAPYGGEFSKSVVPVKKGGIFRYLIHGGTTANETTVTFVPVNGSL